MLKMMVTCKVEFHYIDSIVELCYADIIYVKSISKKYMHGKCNENMCFVVLIVLSFFFIPVSCLQ